MIGGFAASSLIVVNEVVGIGKAIHLRQHVALVEVGPSMQDDDRWTVADLASIEFGAPNIDVEFAGRCGLLAGKVSRQAAGKAQAARQHPEREDRLQSHRAKLQQAERVDNCRSSQAPIYNRRNWNSR